MIESARQLPSMGHRVGFLQLHVLGLDLGVVFILHSVALLCPSIICAILLIHE